MEQQESPKQKPIESPSGIDLTPQTPPTVRVSKRAGFVAISALAGVGGLFGYGIYERHAKQMQATLRADTRENAQPAERAANEITKNIPAGTVTASRNPATRRLCQISTMPAKRVDRLILRIERRILKLHRQVAPSHRKPSSRYPLCSSYGRQLQNRSV